MAKGQTLSAGGGLGLAWGDCFHPLVRGCGLIPRVTAAATAVAAYISWVALVSASRPSLGVTGVTSRVWGLGLAGTIMLRPSWRRGVGSAMLVICMYTLWLGGPVLGTGSSGWAPWTRLQERLSHLVEAHSHGADLHWLGIIILWQLDASR